MKFSTLISFAILGTTALAAATPASSSSTTSLKRRVRRTNCPAKVTSCKCLPGDACWPKPQLWNALNNTVGGRLIASDPPAKVCHDPHYDEEKCNHVKANYLDADWHLDNAFSPMNFRYTNYTCSPYTPREEPCSLDGYAAYAIKATSYKDIKHGIKFAKKHNLRLVIRNTGHDFMGKSTAPGALVIWTYYLKSIEYLPNYTGPTYTGKAFRVGAGVSVFDLYEAAGAKGLEVVGGECPSVGLAGGYIQGGGHSPLGNIHGMGADQALQYEVVTADGKYVIASPTKNSDLFWALSGGGGGTFGVVTSVVIKAFETGITTANQLVFSLPQGDPTSKDKFYKFLKFYHSQVPSYNDAGIYSYPLYGLLGPAYTFMLQPFFAPRLTKAQTDEFLAPLRAKMVELGITPVVDETTQYPSFWDAAQKVFPRETAKNSPVGGRLIPAEDLASRPDEIQAAFEKFIEAGTLGIEFSLRPTLERGGNPDNSVHPAWRKNEIHLILGASYPDHPSPSEIAEIDRTMTSEWNAALKAATPNGAQYMNEGDANEPDWQNVFYGGNYPRLLKIKEKWDPEGIFWARTAVGSEKWVEKGGVLGRLCKANAV